jgi:hypothetical protein
MAYRDPRYRLIKINFKFILVEICFIDYRVLTRNLLKMQLLNL